MLGLWAYRSEVVPRRVDRGEVVQGHGVVVVDAHVVHHVRHPVPDQRVGELGGQRQVGLVHGDHRLWVGAVGGRVAHTVRGHDLVEEVREVRELHSADGHLVLEEDQWLVEGDPHGAVAGPAVSDELGKAAERFDGSRREHPALIGEPARVHEMHHRDHGRHAVRANRVDDAVVVLSASSSYSPLAGSIRAHSTLNRNVLTPIAAALAMSSS